MSFLPNEQNEQYNQTRANQVSNKVAVVRWKTVILVGTFVVGLALVSVTVLVYCFPQTKAAVMFGKKLPIPVAIVGTSSIITTSALESNVDAVERFYDRKQNVLHDAGVVVSFSGPDGEKRLLLKRKNILQKMIEDRLIEAIGRARGIIVTDDDLTQNVDRKLEEYGSREGLTKSLAEDYGWTVNDFKQAVVRPSLYSEALQKQFSEDKSQNIAAKQKIDEALSEMESGRSFESVAAKYSEGATANKGGDLGWIPLTSVTPELVTAIDAQTTRAPTKVVESALGYHILLVEERKTENDVVLVHLKQIFTRKKVFADWLVEQERQYRVFIPVRGYFWNADAGQIEMTDGDLKEFEKTLRQQPNGIFL